MNKSSKKSKSSKKCPKGQILKKAYTTKKGTKVPATCIKDMGKPGKGPKLFEIPEEDIGLLGDFGYTLKKKHEDRVKALKKAIKENNALKILRHLNALRTLQKSNEKYFKKLDKDVKWIQKNYFD
jgi:hypothetical protein